MIDRSLNNQVVPPGELNRFSVLGELLLLLLLLPEEELLLEFVPEPEPVSVPD